MIFFTTILVILLSILEIQAATNLDSGNSCIVQYLKSKKRLDESFPYPTEPDFGKCRIVMPLILKSFENALRQKLSEKENIRVDCIMEHFKNISAMDFLLMREIIPMSRGIENSEITQKTRNVTKVMRKILINGAKRCESDQSYGGLFDDILGLQNMSLPVLQHNYCYTKYAIENKLIEVKLVNMNPRRISTTYLDCEEMIEVYQVEKEKELLERLSVKKFSKENIQCIMDKYRSEKAFYSNIALEVIDILHISYEEKRENREKIATQLETFFKSVFVCTKENNESYQNVGESVKILQF